MTRQAKIGKSGFVALKSGELGQVSGGVQETIIDVVAAPLVDLFLEDQLDQIKWQPIDIGGLTSPALPDESNAPDHDCESISDQDENSPDTEKDEKAKELAAAINLILGTIPSVQNTSASDEYGGLIYLDEDGNVQSFGPVKFDKVGLTGSLYSPEPLYTAFDEAGLDPSSIVGLVHNHPSGIFTDTDLNRYPSSTDWAAASAYVKQHELSDYSLYIVDGSGEVREFKFSDKELYENLTVQQMQEGENLPASADSTNHCGNESS